MTSRDRFQGFITTGEVDRESPEGEIGERLPSSTRRWLSSTSFEHLPTDVSVTVVINQRDQTQSGTFEKFPVTAVPPSIDILSELEKIEQLFQDLSGHFDEEDLRQLILVEIKKKVGQLVQATMQYNNYFSQSTTLVEDALSFIRSEDMTKDQVKGMQDVVQILKKINLERESARQCGRILRRHNIRTIPSLD